MFAGWQCDRAAPAVTEGAFSCLDEDRGRLQLVLKRRDWACEHHFETRIRRLHNVLAGSHNVENFSTMPSDRGVCILFFRPDGTSMTVLIVFVFQRRCIYRFLVQFSPRGGSDDLRGVITPAISKLAVLAIF